MSIFLSENGKPSNPAHEKRYRLYGEAEGTDGVREAISLERPSKRIAISQGIGLDRRHEPKDINQTIS